MGRPMSRSELLQVGPFLLLPSLDDSIVRILRQIPVMIGAIRFGFDETILVAKVKAGIMN
jgi:hypothetical protein